MDNRRDLPGYKYYTRPDGYRPAVYVAFLDLAATGPAAVSPSAGVAGVCLPVDEPALSRLDARERNYERVDISDRVPGAEGRVWVYLGTEDGRERLARGRKLGTTVIDAVYLRAVRAGLSRLSQAQPRGGRDLPCPAPLPVLELVRHDLA